MWRSVPSSRHAFFSHRNVIEPDHGFIFNSAVLQGHTVDTNSAFLTRALRKLGVSVQRITVIPDIQEIIAKEVSLLSGQYTHLITSGGIGPTHDDVTFESVAMAFQEELYPHPELAHLVQEFFGVVDKNSATLKLAMVPRSAKLNYGTDPQTGKPLRYPLVGKHEVRFFNVFTFNNTQANKKKQK